MSTIVIVDDQAVNRTIYAKIASSIADDVRTRTFGCSFSGGVAVTCIPLKRNSGIPVWGLASSPQYAKLSLYLL
jgi:hypothetical protein